MNDTMIQAVIIPPREETVRQMLMKKGILSSKKLSLMSTDDLENFLAENYLVMPMCQSEDIQPFTDSDEYGNIIEYSKKSACNWTLIPKDKQEEINKLGIMIPGEEFFH